jgi:hypothetical protein
LIDTAPHPASLPGVVCDQPSTDTVVPSTLVSLFFPFSVCIFLPYPFGVLFPLAGPTNLLL